MQTISFDFNATALDRLKRGDERMWERLFDAFGATIRSIAAWPKWRFDDQTQADVVQTARSEIVKAVAHLDDPSCLTAFVKRICVRRCIDEVRRQVRSRRFLPLETRNEDGDWQAFDVPTDERFDPVELIARRERAAALGQCVARLEPPCRDVIQAFYVDDKPYKEIAAGLNLSVNTVGTRLARCLEKLRAFLDASPDFS